MYEIKFVTVIEKASNIVLDELKGAKRRVGTDKCMISRMNEIL